MKQDQKPNTGRHLTRRQVISTMSIVTVGSAAALSGDPSSVGGALRGGTMALTEDFKLADSERTLYQGPDSAKDAITGQDGDRYEAVDTQLAYYWDSGWEPLGVGSDSNPAPASHFQSLSTERIDNKSVFGSEFYASAADYVTSGDGSKDSPWVCDFNAILDDFPEDTPGTVQLSPGHYEPIEKIDCSLGIRQRDGTSQRFDTWINPTFVGAGGGPGKYTTSIIVPDSFNDDVFLVDTTADMASDDATVGGGLYGIIIRGNRDNNTSGSGIKFERGTAEGIHTQFNFWDVMVRNIAVHGIDDTNGLWQESCCVDLSLNRAGDATANLQSGSQRNQFIGCRFTFSWNDHGIRLRGKRNMFSGCWFRENSGAGILLDQDHNAFSACVVAENSSEAGENSPQVAFEGSADNNTFHGVVDAGGHTDTGIRDKGTDNDWQAQVVNVNSERYLVTEATRPRYFGVIGAGPLGGVDLGTTTGQYAGDEALADGTTGTAWLKAVWTGSAWQQSDGSATITPS